MPVRRGEQADGEGVLVERFDLRRTSDDASASGFYNAGDHHLVGYALTPGYETYEGLGWYGVVQQGPSHASDDEISTTSVPSGRSTTLAVAEKALAA